MSQTPSSGKTKDAKAAALSRDLSEFLLEFSIGMHRYVMYPPQHPSLLPAAENVVGRLSELLRNRPALSIGVARDRLLIEDGATDRDHPVLRDLARRLHEQQLAAVTFRRGVDVEEMEGLLKAVCREGDRDGKPLGLLPGDRLPSWTHVQIVPLAYDRLEMKDDPEWVETEPGRAGQLWMALARAALSSDAAAGEMPPAESLARAIGRRRGADAYERGIANHLLELTHGLRGNRGPVAESVRDRVSTLVRELDRDTLEELMELGGSTQRRHRFVLDATESLAVDAVLKILRAAAGASEQTISTSLTRLLTKLSLHAEKGATRVGSQADTALRENVEELIEDWELTDPNPDRYTAVLDSMASATPVFEGDDGEGTGPGGARRILQMSLEVDTWGPTVEKAAADLMDAGEVAFLIELMGQVGEGSEVGQRLQSCLTSPDRFRRLLEGDDVEISTLRSLATRMGEAAIPLLLDGLVESQSRPVRRKVFDILKESGPGVGRPVTERLDDPRWYVVRNLLALLRQLSERPDGFSASSYLHHEDHRVRREAFPLALEESGTRSRVLASGLADDDERLVRMALLELQDTIPETLVPVVVSRVVSASRPPELRALGVRTLEGSASTLALETLLDVCSGGKTLLGRRRLAPPSPEVVAAVGVLARSWSHDPRAQEVLELAGKSKDPEIRHAAEREGGRP